MFILPDSPFPAKLPPGFLSRECWEITCQENWWGWCHAKRLDYCLKWREAHDFCETCGQTMSTHLRCAGCTVLVGPNHLQGGVGPGGRCGSCLDGIRKSPLTVQKEAQDEALKEKKERIQELWAEGKPKEAIARELGISLRTVFRHTKDL